MTHLDPQPPPVSGTGDVWRDVIHATHILAPPELVLDFARRGGCAGVPSSSPRS